MGLLFRRNKVKLNFKDGRPEVFKLTQMPIPKIRYKALVNEISVAMGESTNKTRAIVDALVNRTAHYLAEGHLVEMGQLGSLKPKFRSKTVKRADDLDERTIRYVGVQFYPGQAFKEMSAAMEVRHAGARYDAPGTEGSHGGGAGGDE